MSRVDFEPLAGWPALWIAAALAALALAWTIRRDWRFALFRAPITLLILAALSGPVRLVEDRRPLADVAVVVLDMSESMDLAGRAAGARRAADRIAARLKAAGLEVREARHGDEESGRNRSASSPDAALDKALADVDPGRIAGAILVTDGHAPEPDGPPAERPWPVHRIVPADSRETDRAVRLVSVPRSVEIGSPVRVRVRYEGDADGPALADVRTDAGETRKVRLEPGKDTDVTVAATRRGPLRIVISVPAAPGDLSLANNAIVAETMATRERLRALLITGSPHAGARAWRNLLKSDPSVDLVHVMILRGADDVDPTPNEEMSLIPFPTRELFLERLDSFDLVVLDRFRRQDVVPDSHLDALAQWVEGGGALLVAAGPAEATGNGVGATPLARLSSLRVTGSWRPGPVRPTLTAPGRVHPVSAPLAGSEASWGPWDGVLPGQAQPGADVLMAAGGAPALTLAAAASGRVAWLSADGVWLWSRGLDGGGPFADLFRRTAHWLMRAPELEVGQMEARGVRGGLEASVLGGGDPGPIEVSGSGRPFAMQPAVVSDGLWRARAATPAAGLHEVRAAGRAPVPVLAGFGDPDEAWPLTVEAAALRAKRDSGSGGGGAFLVGRAGEGPLPSIARIGRGARAVSSGKSMELRENHASRAVNVRRDQLVPPPLMAALILLAALWAWWREGLGAPVRARRGTR